MINPIGGISGALVIKGSRTDNDPIIVKPIGTAARRKFDGVLPIFGAVARAITDYPARAVFPQVAALVR